MKLATLKHPHKRDGELVVVSRDNKWAARASEVAPNLLAAMENWDSAQPKLARIYTELNENKRSDRFAVDKNQLHSPLPRSFQWIDASSFIHHVKLVRLARKAPLPETLETVPLIYQGGSDDFLAPMDSIPQISFSHGTDFEAEVCVVTSFVPMGVNPRQALEHIQLVMLCNDVSLRGLIMEEIKQGFGFFQGKPSTAFSPFALTLDELGKSWRDGRLHLPLQVELNGKFFGKANAGEMFFHFGQIIAHAARTRNLTAGTIVGSGTVSNDNPDVGSSCLAEKRMLETIATGTATTPFMKVGDRIKIEMRNEAGENLFGTIDQVVKVADAPDMISVVES